MMLFIVKPFLSETNFNQMMFQVHANYDQNIQTIRNCLYLFRDFYHKYVVFPLFIFIIMSAILLENTNPSSINMFQARNVQY